jgi:hypothetical protein
VYIKEKQGELKTQHFEQSIVETLKALGDFKTAEGPEYEDLAFDDCKNESFFDNKLKMNRTIQYDTEEEKS